MFDPALLAVVLAARAAAPASRVAWSATAKPPVDPMRAAEAAADLLAQGVTDIRVVSAYLLGVFVERGPSALPALLAALSDAVSTWWTSINPEAHRERVVDAALGALFGDIERMLLDEESTHGHVWRTWSGQMTAARSDALPDAMRVLCMTLTARIAGAPSLDALARVGGCAILYGGNAHRGAS